MAEQSRDIDFTRSGNFKRWKVGYSAALDAIARAALTDAALAYSAVVLHESESAVTAPLSTPRQLAGMTEEPVLQ